MLDTTNFLRIVCIPLLFLIFPRCSKKRKKNKKEGIRSSDDYEKYERSHLTFKDFVIRF